MISSVKNSLILSIKKVKEGKSKKLFIESPKLIEEAYNSRLVFDCILVDEKKIEQLKNNYSFLRELNYELVTSNVIESLSDTKTPQGIVAVVNYDFCSDLIPKGKFIVLENIQDPGNLGTIIRSARGTDFNDIYLINTVSPLNPKVIRSAMGALFCAKLHLISNFQEFKKLQEDNKLNLYVADMNGKNLFEIKELPERFGIVIGNEGNGVSSMMKDLISNSISIPMKHSLESLNAGVSCSIIIYYLDNIAKYNK